MVFFLPEPTSSLPACLPSSAFALDSVTAHTSFAAVGVWAPPGFAAKVSWTPSTLAIHYLKIIRKHHPSSATARAFFCRSSPPVIQSVQQAPPDPIILSHLRRPYAASHREALVSPQALRALFEERLRPAFGSTVLFLIVAFASEYFA